MPTNARCSTISENLKLVYLKSRKYGIYDTVTTYINYVIMVYVGISNFI